MIEIAITSSPDEEVIGTHRYFFENIYLGPYPSCHLVIGDPHLEGLILIFENTEKGVAVSERGGNFYLSNGKKISGKRIHKKGDVITLGHTVFKIMEYSSLSKKRTSPLKDNGEKILKAVDSEISSIKRYISS